MLKKVTIGKTQVKCLAWVGMVSPASRPQQYSFFAVMPDCEGLNNPYLDLISQ